MRLPQKLPYDLMQTKWASQLDPLLANQLTQGLLLTDKILAPGDTTINHLLGRKMVGWIITDQDAAASIYRSKPLNDLTLTLNSTVEVTVNLWVF